MARGVNKAILIGTLGGDPEVRYTSGGSAVTNISVATNESWTDKQTGEKKESTEWHRVVFFNRLAEVAGEYLKKGSQVYIEGKIQTKKWDDSSGVTRYSTQIVANQMQMLGGKSEGQARPQTSNEQAGGFRDNPPQQNQAANTNTQQQQPHFEDDDIPF